VRQIVIAAVALVLGVVLGGLAPRSQVRSLEKQLEEAEDCKGSGMGTEIATMLGAGRLSQPEPEPEPEPEPQDDAADTDEPDRNGIQIRVNDDDDVTPEQGMAAMREALELRRTQARAALIEDAEPSDQQLDDFDAAVDKMNDELLDLAKDFVAEFEEGGEPTRRDAMAFAADALDVLVTAEDSFAASLDDDQLEALPEEALDPLSHLDPELLDLLAQLDQMGAGN
jgi:hypothetical protein